MRSLRSATLHLISAWLFLLALTQTATSFVPHPSLCHSARHVDFLQTAPSPTAASTATTTTKTATTTTITRTSRYPRQSRLFIGTGFSFNDGEQVLISVQKPLGIILEQDSDDGAILVTEVDPSGSAANAGVQVGDVLMAVQNASTENADLDDVLEFMGQAPRVINLRFLRFEPE